ncbi:MAG: ABC transporter permease [Lachnospiraceae bacterium]|nr:ABC transporter permease [Lachnospiraceae bacterium]
MRRSGRRITLKHIIWTAICLICLLLVGVLQIVSARMQKQLLHERVAYDWDSEGGSAHISVYLTEEEKLSMLSSLEDQEYMVLNLYYSLESELTENSITLSEDASDNARLIVYGYEAEGSVSIESDRTTITVKAYGVGGDFFQFHPLQLKYGSYFSGSDLMQDGVLLDEEAAWQLFGSSDVVGQYVYISNIPHLVVGVYERDRGYFYDAAGNDESTVYLSAQSLFQYGSYNGLQSVELLMPNPVSGFAYDLVAEQLSGYDVAIVENENRFEWLNLADIWKQIGTRSMGLNGIVFPYWENVARGYEDVLAGILLIQAVLLSFVLVVLVISLWKAWLRRNWRTRDVVSKLGDLWYEQGAKRQKKKNEKNGEEPYPFAILTFEDDEENEEVFSEKNEEQ